MKRIYIPTMHPYNEHWVRLNKRKQHNTRWLICSAMQQHVLYSRSCFLVLLLQICITTPMTCRNVPTSVWSHFIFVVEKKIEKISLFRLFMFPSLKLVIMLNYTMRWRKIRKDLSKLLSTWRRSYSVAEASFLHQTEDFWGV